MNNVYEFWEYFAFYFLSNTIAIEIIVMVMSAFWLWLLMNGKKS